MSNEQKCPFSATALSGRSNRDWWPNQLNLSALHTNHPAGDPMGQGFNYAEEFLSLDLGALKKDIEAVMTNSRSEEHTSELQSQSNLVCRLLLEKKKTD